MVLKDAHRAGYGAMTTPTRLVLRSPYNMPETYAEEVSLCPSVFCILVYHFPIDIYWLEYACHVEGSLSFSPQVAGVPMEIFSVSTYYKQVCRLAIMVSAAACPTGMYMLFKWDSHYVLIPAWSSAVA